MVAWVLVPCLVSLRTEFNKLAPNRDKASDGSIGDSAHSRSSSDHNPDETGVTPYEDSDSINEVHAIDLDKDLRRSGWSMEKAVRIIVERHRTGKDNRLQNIIWNGRIWSRSWGWTARKYTGSNPHDKHAHFSARYTTAQEQDTRPWGLLDAANDLESDQDVTVSKGDKGEDVAYVQYVLTDLGYMKTEQIDGIYGPITEAAVNKYRADKAGAKPITYVSGWQMFSMLRDMMDKRAGKPGPAGPAGPPGKDGEDGRFTGTFVVTGGTFEAQAQ